MRSVTTLSLVVTFMVLQAIVVTMLVVRICSSPLNSATHSHRSFRERLRIVPVANYLLWGSFVAGWVFLVVGLVMIVSKESMSHQICQDSFFLVSYLYALAKVWVYLFLIERAHVVRGMSRLHDKMYWINHAVLLLLAVVLAFFPRCKWS